MKQNHFFWGASTASHQVEGHTQNQWTAWEKAKAEELAKTAHKRYGWQPNWEEIKHQATDPQNYISGHGVEHYEHYKQDFALLKKLNLNSFRFSIQWSRIEPEKGVWNQEAIDHYKKYIHDLRAEGIEPFLNVWHWTCPTWFTDKGGFAKRRNIKYFKAYVKKIAEELLGEVDYVITLNEPNVYMALSYSEGVWPPQEKNKLKAVWVYINLLKAHKVAWKILKKAKPRLKVGVAQHLANVQAYRPSYISDQVVVEVIRYWWNWWWLNRIRNYQDFIGINYYFTDYYKGVKRVQLSSPLGDNGKYLFPSGLLELIQRANAHFPNVPIIITENGLADAKDHYRRWWLEESMIAIDTAKSQNIPVIGYLHWSLLDNFEWADGWWPKFGLVEVNRSTMERKIRPSALWWAGELKERELKNKS
jgi:beta-glucosidase